MFRIKLNVTSLSNEMVVSKFLFFVALFVRLTIGALSITMYSNSYFFLIIYRVMKYGVIFLLIGSFVLQQRFSYKFLCYVIGSGAVVAMSYVSSHSLTIIELLLFIICARNVKFDYIVKMIFWIHIVIGIACIVGSQIGIIENLVYFQENRVRHSLGYKYATYITKVFFFCVMYYIFMKKKKITLLSVAVIIIINQFLYTQTVSRTTYWLVNMTIIFCYLFKFEKLRKISNYKIYPLLTWIYPFCAAISFAVLYLYINHPSNILDRLNEVLTGRLYISSYVFEENPVNLFGHYMQWIGQAAQLKNPNERINFLDCAYFNIAINYGIIVLILILAAFVKITHFAIKNKDIIEVMVLVISAIHCMIEPQLVDLTYNVFILLLMQSLDVRGFNSFFRNVKFSLKQE